MFDVLGTRVDAVDMSGAIARIDRLMEPGACGSLSFCTVSTVLEARKDPELRAALNGSTLVCPDGMPMVWLGRRAGLSLDRVYGPDLMKAVFAGRPGLRHYFYGGTPETLTLLESRLRRSYPGIAIVGSFAPGRVDGTSVAQEDVARINAARPDVVWVGLGHPKQEKWIHAHRDHLDAPVLAGVGAAFDFLAETKREAPGWMQRSGLQWLHRLGSEPTRLWRRYLIGNSLFLALLIRERFRVGTVTANVD